MKYVYYVVSLTKAERDLVYELVLGEHQHTRDDDRAGSCMRVLEALEDQPLALPATGGSNGHSTK